MTAKWLQVVAPIIAMIREDENAKKSREVADQLMRLRESLIAIMGEEAASEIINSNEKPSKPERYRLGDYEFGVSSGSCSLGFFIYHGNTPKKKSPFGGYDGYQSSWITDRTDWANQVSTLQKNVEKNKRQQEEAEAAKQEAEARKAAIQEVEPPKSAVWPQYMDVYPELVILVSKLEKGRTVSAEYEVFIDLIRFGLSMNKRADQLAQQYAPDDGDSDYDGDDDDDGDDE